MRAMLVLLTLTVILGLPLAAAEAHCDAIDGPVATAALKALETKNVNVVLPYVPAEAETELTAAFDGAVVVRDKGTEARNLANRYFMETAVRLHRAGEKAPYTGLRPAGTDFGPAIPATEKAIASGSLEPVLELVTHHVKHGIVERFEHVRHATATMEPATSEGVPAARERVRAELELITYVHGVYLATQGGAHAE